MAAGGKRKGAGRPRGATNRKTRELQERVAATGVEPLDVMLAAMRHLYDHAQKLQADDFAQDAEAVTAAFVGAAAIAKDAAPYVHPKLANVQHSGPDGGPLVVEIVKFGGET